MSSPSVCWALALALLAACGTQTSSPTRVASSATSAGVSAASSSGSAAGTTGSEATGSGVSGGRATGGGSSTSVGGSSQGTSTGAEGLEQVPAGAVPIQVDGSALLGRVSPRYLSFALDTSQVVGGNWWVADGGQAPTTPFDFSRAELMRLTQPLAPAILRIGGTAADQVYYDLGTPPLASPPFKYNYLFTKSEFDAVNQFAEAAGLQVLFTLNAGTGPRLPNLLWSEAWTPDQAKTLIDYAVSSGYPVIAWELGNEINAYPLEIHLIGITADVYANDTATADQLLSTDDPGARLAGPSSAYWPQLGEVNPILPSFLADDAAMGGQLVGLVTWHYYPQESDRCAAAVVPATPDTMLQPANLDEVGKWAAQVLALQQADAPGGEVWLSETGNAQCGGQASVSDAFASSFWWLDQLGLLARGGVTVQVRQTLVGADYGLLDDELHPRPDYWASLLWKRLMGTGVLSASVAGPNTLRAYAHCTGDGSAAVSVLALNLSASQAATVVINGLGGTQVDQFVVTATSLTATQVSLNGQLLALPAAGAPSVAPAPHRQAAPFVTLPPQSYAFLRIRDAVAGACP